MKAEASMFNWSHSRRRRKQSYASSVVSLEKRLLPSAIAVQTTPRSDGSVDVSIQGTNGADSISIDPDTGGGVILTTVASSGFSLNGSAPTSTVTLSRLRNLTVDLRSGDDSLIMTDVSAKDVTIRDSSSTAEGGFYAVRSVQTEVMLRDLRLETNNVSFIMNLESLKYLQLRNFAEFVSTAQQTRTQINCSLQAVLNVTGDLSLMSKSSSSQDTLEFQSYGNSVVGAIRLETGPGADSVLVSGSAVVNGDVRVSTESGEDSVALRGSRYGRTVQVDSGDGDDMVFLESTSNQAIVSGAVVIQTGAGNDFVRLNNVILSRSLQVDAGRSGAVVGPFGTYDWVWITNAQVSGTTQVRVPGKGKVSVDSNSGGHLPTRFRATATFEVGSGNIEVGVDGDAPVGFDARLIFVGLKDRLPVKFGPNAIFNSSLRRLINAFPA